MSTVDVKPATVESIVNQATQMTIAQRVEIVRELTDQIEKQDPSAWLTPEQSADLQMRIDELDSGKAELADADEVFDRLRKRLT